VARSSGIPHTNICGVRKILVERGDVEIFFRLRELIGLAKSHILLQVWGSDPAGQA